MELLAFITSFAALVVSFVALYLASLRLANIEIDPIENLSGGHFAAFEEPELLAGDLIEFLAGL